MPIDERTTRFGLELPAQANTLKNDVNRLRDAMNVLDQKAAMLDDNGKVKTEQLQDVVPLLDDNLLIKTDNLPPSVVMLDPGETTLTDRQIPQHLLLATFDVARESLITELDAKIGDIVTITSSTRMFELKALPASNRDNWKELVQVGISKVNGQPLLANNFDGDLKVAEPGVNTNITNLTGLSGPLVLGGQGRTGYEAVTYDQLVGAMGTSGGASMSGVMNNFIGAVEWFMGTRPNFPAGHEPADGQLLKRADYPDMWAAIKSGLIKAVPDSLWTASTTGRANFSFGDGDINTGTTFRLPDLNGIAQPGKDGIPASALKSVPGLFLRGDGSVEAGIAGSVRQNAAPNITGYMAAGSSGSYAQLFLDQKNIGALTTDNSGFPDKPGDSIGSTPPVDGMKSRKNTLHFNASLSHPAYGRAEGSANSATEVRPNSASGIWLIRVSGSFTAANAIFEVINSATALPAKGTVVTGGQVNTTYKVGSETQFAAGFNVTANIGNDVTAVWGVAAINPQTNSLSWKHMDLDWASGRLSVPGAVVLNQGSLFASQDFNPLTAGPGGKPPVNGNIVSGPGIWLTGTQNGGQRFQSALYAEMAWGGVARTMISTFDPSITNAQGTLGDTKYWFFMADGSMNSSAGSIHAAGSDRKLKKDIVDAPTGAPDRIKQIRLRDFTYIATQRPSRGWIAQELEEIDPIYVFETEDDPVQKTKVKNVEDRAIVADLIATVQMLMARVSELEAKLAS